MLGKLLSRLRELLLQQEIRLYQLQLVNQHLERIVPELTEPMVLEVFHSTRTMANHVALFGGFRCKNSDSANSPATKFAADDFRCNENSTKTRPNHESTKQSQREIDIEVSQGMWKFGVVVALDDQDSQWLLWLWF